MLSNSRYLQDEDRLQLTPQTVLGTTTNSPNAFDSSASHHVFVYCAGPAAIVSHVSKDLTIDQRLFRARSDALPVNTTSSFYNAATPPVTPTRTRQALPLKEANYRHGLGTPSGILADSQTHVKAQNRVREATSVSLSGRGHLLAVGEVNCKPQNLPFILMTTDWV